MRKTSEARKERLEARVTPEFKAQLLLAASIEGKTLTDFAVEHLGKAAATVLQDHTQWKLSQADSIAFVEAILNPEPPSPRLLEAVRRYRKRASL